MYQFYDLFTRSRLNFMIHVFFHSLSHTFVLFFWIHEFCLIHLILFFHWNRRFNFTSNSIRIRFGLIEIHFNCTKFILSFLFYFHFIRIFLSFVVIFFLVFFIIFFGPLFIFSFHFPFFPVVCNSFGHDQPIEFFLALLAF